MRSASLVSRSAPWIESSWRRPRACPPFSCSPTHSSPAGLRVWMATSRPFSVRTRSLEGWPFPPASTSSPSRTSRAPGRRSRVDDRHCLSAHPVFRDPPTGAGLVREALGSSTGRAAVLAGFWPVPALNQSVLVPPRRRSRVVFRQPLLASLPPRSPRARGAHLLPPVRLRQETPSRPWRSHFPRGGSD